MGLQKGNQFNDAEIHYKTNRHQKLRFYLTWPVMILVLILFFPLGIYLIYRRTVEDKEAAFKIYKLVNFFGWFFLIIAAMYIIDMIFVLEYYYSYPFIVYLVLGLFFIVWGRRLKARSIRYKKYLRMVFLEQKRKVGDIANSLGLSEHVVKADLIKMSARGYFLAGYFDMTSDSMVFPYMDFRKEYPKTTIKEEIKVVTCKGCGASNTVLEGTVAECDYCGSKLS